MIALQEFLNWWENDFPDWEKSSEGYSVVLKLKELLEKEKHQIIHAYEMGVAEQKAGIALKSGNEFYEMNYE